MGSHLNPFSLRVPRASRDSRASRRRRRYIVNNAFAFPAIQPGTADVDEYSKELE